MINYYALLKKAYSVTIHNPLLWVFGLFLSGGFNGNIFYFANVPFGWRNLVRTHFENGLPLISIRPSPYTIGGSIVVFLVVVFLVNWLKVVFILKVSHVLQLQRRMSAVQQHDQSQHARPTEEPVLWSALIKESLEFVPRVALASLITISLTVTGLSVIGYMLQFIGTIPLDTTIIRLIAASCAVIVVVGLSLINLFTVFFVVLYRYGLVASYGWAMQLIRKCWVPIAETVIMLMVIYGLCFFVGTSLAALSGSVIQSGVIIWIWLALVNTFFNVSLLLLFALLVKPPLYPEFLREAVIRRPIAHPIA